MLTSSDIMAGKIATQLGLASADVVRAALRHLAACPAKGLVEHLVASRSLRQDQGEAVASRVVLYNHVRSTSSYMRALAKETTISHNVINRLAANVERTRARLGDVLVG